MELIAVSKRIEEKIRTLELGREILKEYAQNKANTIANYEKAIAKVLIRLKNGDEFTLEGEVIKSPPASVMEKIAKGICFNEKLAQELAEAQYKNAIVGMGAIEAELNGYQSIFRHLEHETTEDTWKK